MRSAHKVALLLSDELFQTVLLYFRVAETEHSDASVALVRRKIRIRVGLGNRATYPAPRPERRSGVRVPRPRAPRTPTFSPA